MALFIFNSVSRKKERFTPLLKNYVSMYVCGITPNNATHLGHAFTYVSFDVLVRYLSYKKYKINYLQNATDINDSDDVILQAKNDGRTWKEEASYWINHFKKQMDTLNVIRPTKYVLATEVIPQIIKVNRKLLERGYAYEKNGNVYFDVLKFKKYGFLSTYSVKKMLAVSKERGNNPDDKNKKNPLDFVLWLKSNDIPNWDSPWGKGRPGWHIECSTMINFILGSQIDIHGGGEDLIFPHHESEIAQAESYTGKSPFVKYWMHTAYVRYKGEKMSKSLGNLILVEDLLKKYSPFFIRYYLISHHYRKPWEFKEAQLEQIDQKVKKIRKILSLKTDKKNLKKIDMKEFEAYMNDDLNTPMVLRLVDRLISEKKLKETKVILKTLGFIL